MTRVKWLLFGIVWLLHSRVSAQLTQPNSPLLTRIFSFSSPAFFDVISQPEKYHYQIAYSRINRNAKGKPDLETHYFNCSRNQYLYPASLAKLPACALGLQKIETLRKYGVNAKTSMITDTVEYCQTPVWWDSTQANLRPSLEGYIKKMMLVSDNDAYNRVYEFLGYDYIRESLKKRSLQDVRIVQRFLPPCDDNSYLNTNPVYFLRGTDTLYKQHSAWAENRMGNPLGEVFMGKAYYDASGYLFPFSRSFYYNNFIPVEELHSILARIYFPSEFSSSKRFDVSDSNLNILKKYMGMWPKECTYPAYPLPDNYKKYFLIGDGRPMPGNSDIRIFNAVGRAYGVIADCAYIVDFKNDLEFMLTAILYCNEDEVLNDDKYEYYTVGLPFLSELGSLVYSYELNRKRKYRYHLTELENLFPSGKTEK